MIIIIILIIILILILNNYQQIEYLTYDIKDPRAFPINMDPSELDEISFRRHGNMVTTYKHVTLDKFNKPEHVSYEKPLPELGQVACEQVICPSWTHRINCWKCY